MRCSNCGSDNPAGNKFCGDCGSPLANRCTNCSADNPRGKPFCGNCGAALLAATSRSPASSGQVPEVVTTIKQARASTTVDGERKTVTALFADIKGSTELMEKLDPEEARAVIDPVLQLMMDAVHRYDGYVVQSAGDGIFALFGAPVAHEDHPQRAVHAAIAMHEALHRRDVDQPGRPAVETRIGINTGEVVLRLVHTGGHTEYTPVGHAANLAARMQSAAPADGIVISADTRRLVEGYFELYGLGPTEVKGVSEPLDVYEVIRTGPLHGHFDLSMRRGLTKFVGREREIADMKRALELAHHGHGQIVGMVAEAGTGKSRLFHEFKATLPAESKVLEAYSVSHGKASAWLPVLALLHDYVGIQEADDPATRREKLRAVLAALDPALADTQPYLFALLAIAESPDPIAQMDPRVKRRRTLEALKRLVLRESLNQPVVVIFEDLHWIDSETQALLDALADGIANARILLLVNYRPEYRHEWGHKSYYSQLRLDALDSRGAAEMLAALLGDGVELNPLKRLITERTEGNPFFIEEMVQALFDQGAIVRNGMVKVAHSLSQLRLPPTVQGILASRIDRLRIEQKELLQTMAVIGRESSFALIRKIASCGDGELEQMLSALQAGEFIYEQPAVAGIEYSFKHALTQEVAYNSLLLERRKLLHEGAGAAIEALHGGRLDDHLSELARHYQRSANTAKALEYLGRAGQQALQRSSHTEAIGLFTSALELLQTLPETAERLEQELALQLGLGAALTAAKGWGAAEVGELFAWARKLCQQIGETPHLFQVLSGLFAYYVLRGEMKPALELAKQLLSIAQNTGDATLLPAAHHAMGHAPFLMGQFIPARTHLELAYSLYDPDRYPSHAVPYFSCDIAVHSLGILSGTLGCLGFPDQAVATAERAVALARELDHPFSLCLALWMSQNVHDFRGDITAALKFTDAYLQIANERGFQAFSPLAILYRGAALVVSGQTEEGIAHLREGLDAARATGAEAFWSGYLPYLATGYALLGRVEESFVLLAEAMAFVESTGFRLLEANLYRFKGELTLMRPGAVSNSEAKSCFRQAIEVARLQNAKSWELRATTSLARLLASEGRRDEARAMLAEIYSWFTEGFDTIDLKDAKTLLDELAT
jgi:class 3 adenylate cyclase/predicted ATPase